MPSGDHVGHSAIRIALQVTTAIKSAAANSSTGSRPSPPGNGCNKPRRRRFHWLTNGLLDLRASALCERPRSAAETTKFMCVESREVRKSMSPTILGRISSQTFPQTATGSRLFLAQREVVRIGSGAGPVSGTNFALLVARFRTLFLGTQILGTQILGIRSHFHYRSRMERRLQPRRYGRGATWYGC